ncbi:heterokaryon incompatibility protein-domain-containing protein [Xylariaceae sp. FL1651]|nr:heterokaryon incompatibility protein-domain-containing protein [Xylariaceae sp. FL1651]
MEAASPDSNTVQRLCNKCAEYDWAYIISGYKTPDGGLEEDIKCLKSSSWGTAGVMGGSYYRRRHYPGVFWKRDPHPNPTLRETFIFPLLSLGEMDSTASTCSVCSFVLASALTPTSDLTKTAFWRSEWPKDSDECLDCYVNIGSTVMSDVRITLLEDSLFPNQDKFRYGRLVKSDCIDFQTIKNWWSNCRQYHGQDCSQTQSRAVLPPLSAEVHADFRVIDVKKKTVIPASPDGDYVALSYVWGKPKPGRTFRQAFLNPLPADLSQAQSLPLNMEEIPRTIRDAIDVVEKLGEHYLWVDALCIFQDNISQKTQMIGIMDRIYRQAILTIIAAGGDNSDSGLGGLQPRSRNFKQVVGTICGQRIIKLSTSVGTLLNASSWASRAWTYQEEYFSKFKLIFVGDRVFYQCPSAVGWTEDVTEYVHTDRKPRIKSNINYTNEWPFDAVSNYITHVEKYTTRQLSFPDDILNAFTGIIQEYSRTHHTEFCWGLPKGDFTSALLWRDNWHGLRAYKPHLLKSEEPGLQRRHLSSDTGPELPSWSWAGWEGHVHLPFLSMPGYSPMDINWEWESTESSTAHEALLNNRVISFTAELAELEPHSMDVDHGALRADDGSLWTQGKNTFVLLASFSRPMRYIEGAENVESRTCVVMMLQPGEKGIFHRKGLMVCVDAQWNAAKPQTHAVHLA